MICERCKIREATISYTEIINGQKTEHHFCTQCAQELNFGAASVLFDGEFPFAKLLSALFGEEGEQSDERYAQIVCPNCGMSYQEFVENSRFGCPDCYEVFDLLIQDSIKQIQGNDVHKGKHPKYGLRMVPKSLTADLKGTGPETSSADHTGEENAVLSAGDPKMNRISELRAKLNQAVRNENYEEAATLRDQIRALESED